MIEIPVAAFPLLKIADAALKLGIAIAVFFLVLKPIIDKYLGGSSD